MLRPLTDSLPHGFAKWCAYSLILLAPGSFLILPLMWLIRRCSAQVAAQKPGRDPRRQRIASK